MLTWSDSLIGKRVELCEQTAAESSPNSLPSLSVLEMTGVELGDETQLPWPPDASPTLSGS